MEPHLYFIGSIAALLMGVALGVFGAGGSILTVPLLVYVFQLPAARATHYSLLVVGLVSAVAVARDWKAIRVREVLWFALPAMAGMFVLRRVVLPALPMSVELPLVGDTSLDRLILLVFALFMIAASFSMLFVKIRTEGASEIQDWGRTSGLIVVGMMVGAATGFVGAGGGFLIVPALVFLSGFSIVAATQASLFIIMLNSTWGFFSSPFDWARVPWVILALVTAMAVFGMIIGLWLRRLVNTDRLKPAFGLFVLIMGSFVLWQSWR